MQAYSGSHEAAEGWWKVPCNRIDCDGLKSARLDPATTRNLTESYGVTENLTTIKGFDLIHYIVEQWSLKID
jgi:hypothetical protein